MTRSSFIQLCVYLTLGLSLGAAGWKLAHTSAARMAGAQLFPLIGPVFFALAAKNGARLGRAAVGVAVVGVLLAGGGFWAVVTAPPETPSAGSPGSHR
ncbi:MAG: hypothetical protein ACOYM9_15905 [Bradymonadia bacterium]|jgi:hypothetical protein